MAYTNVMGSHVVGLIPLPLLSQATSHQACWTPLYSLCTCEASAIGHLLVMPAVIMHPQVQTCPQLLVAALANSSQTVHMLAAHMDSSTQPPSTDCPANCVDAGVGGQGDPVGPDETLPGALKQVGALVQLLLLAHNLTSSVRLAARSNSSSVLQCLHACSARRQFVHDRHCS